MTVKPQISFVDAVKTVVLEKYCSFKGRARRSEFWWFVLAYALVSIVCACLQHIGVVGVIIAAIIQLALLLPTLAVDVRRLHDIGKSGWNLLLAFIPLVGAIILLVWSVTDSVPAANEYGPSPKYVEE